MTYAQTARTVANKPYTLDGPSVFDRINAEESMFLATVSVPDGEYLECADFNTALEARHQRSAWGGPTSRNVYVGGVSGRRPWLIIKPITEFATLPEVARVLTYRGNNLVAARTIFPFAKAA